jgi:hypothetical protein
MKLRTWPVHRRGRDPVQRCDLCQVELTGTAASALVPDPAVNRPEDVALHGRRLLLACGPAHLAVLTARHVTASKRTDPAV